MIKQKLKKRRNEKNISQEKIADLLGITQSQYNRRENGNIKISKKEWDKIAKVLDSNLESIYEPDDGIYISPRESYSTDSGGFCQIPNHVLETMRKYIEKLEEEINMLKNSNINRTP